MAAEELQVQGRKMNTVLSGFEITYISDSIEPLHFDKNFLKIGNVIKKKIVLSQAIATSST